MASNKKKQKAKPKPAKGRGMGGLVYVVVAGLALGLVLVLLLRHWRRPPVNPAQEIQRLSMEGARAFAARDFVAAQDDYRKVLVLDPQNYQAHKYLATLLAGSADAKDQVEAIDHANRAVGLRNDFSPETLALRKELAFLLLKQHRWAEAEANARPVAAGNTLDAYAQQYLGFALAGQDKKPEAQAAFEAALKLNPTDAVSKECLDRLKTGKSLEN
jgi:tetratricopeptide (TPR) repeat protein